VSQVALKEPPRDGVEHASKQVSGLLDEGCPDPCDRIVALADPGVTGVVSEEPEAILRLTGLAATSVEPGPRPRSW